MIKFLKNFFAGERAAQPKQRDVLILDVYAMDDEEEEQSGSCGSGGCGGCGCG